VEDVSRSGVLRGAHRGQLYTLGASRLTPQPGAAAVLARSYNRGLPATILSVNWSEDMVRASLKHFNCPHHEPVFSCDLAFDEATELATGLIHNRVPGAQGKVNILLALEASTSSHIGGRRESWASVFVGDSVTDLPALVQANIGIVVGSSSSFVAVAKALGVRVRGLRDVEWSELLLPPQRDTAEAPVEVFHADSWNDIGDFLDFAASGAKHSERDDVDQRQTPEGRPGNAKHQQEALSNEEQVKVDVHEDGGAGASAGPTAVASTTAAPR